MQSTPILQRYCLPGDLLVLALPWLDLKALVVHLMDVASPLHHTQYVVLQLWHSLERIRDVLIRLNLANDLGGLCSLRKVDKIRLLDRRGYTIFDEGQIGQVDT